eukprot:13415723-Alexandrium_andersonii.AAC.1
MSASLVGSEMCIRDRAPSATGGCIKISGHGLQPSHAQGTAGPAAVLRRRAGGGFCPTPPHGP